jgi:hypothetical protein
VFFFFKNSLINLLNREKYAEEFDVLFYFKVNENRNSESNLNNENINNNAYANKKQ